MTQYLLFGMAGYFALAVAATVARGKGASGVFYGLGAVLGGFQTFTALASLLSGVVSPEIILPLGLPGIGAHMRADPLASLFLAVVNFGGFAASLYAIGYGAHEKQPQRVLPWYCAFIGGMNLAVLAHDAYGFLMGWEVMSLASWALVVSDHHSAENRRAGFIYLTMAAFGGLSLILAFALISDGGGDWSFAALRAAQPGAMATGAAVALVFLGAGSKAGLTPLHVWLPLAHPAAPSHVSALMSGVMTKVAVYGFIRIVFDLVGEPQPWQGFTALALGGATAVYGALQATQESDLKKMLAYSTIENIGIVFVGLGLALSFKANGIDWAAALALTAALFHVVNHSLFKSLLFFGAGAVLHGTGERNIETLGGLIHRMPKTAALFLGGAMAISALPPLNGFASEWMLFQSVLVSPVLPQWSLKLVVPAVGAALALSAALCAAAFVRAFGVAFLGRARTDAAAYAHEADRWSLAAMGLLLACCVLAGVLPGVVADAFAPVVTQMVGARLQPQTDVWMTLVPIGQARSSYNGLLVFGFMAITMVLIVQAIHRFASGAIRRGPAWDCGFPQSSPATQYTASSFSQPIRRVFGVTLLGAKERVDMAPPGDRRSGRIWISVRDWFWDGLYAPLEASIGWLADQVNRLHFLTIRGSLALVFSTLVLLLFGAAAWP